MKANTLFTIGVGVGIVTGCMFGIPAGIFLTPVDTTTPTAQTSPAPPQESTGPTITTTLGEPVPTSSPKPSPKPSPKAVTVANGVWTVGSDIPAGTYKTKDPVSVDCYWAILRTGSNGDIEDNGLPGGGRPQVTLKKGFDFQTLDCGTWVKIG